MASVYRIRKEETASGVRYLVDYRDSAGRRTKRRFKKARDAEAFKKQVDMSCGPQKLDLHAVQGIPRLQSHRRMAHPALDISPRSRHNKALSGNKFTVWRRVFGDLQGGAAAA